MTRIGRLLSRLLGSKARSISGPSRRARPRLEALEDRLAPALQVLSVADPNLFGTAAGGTLSGVGRTISDDGRYVVYSGGDNVVPGDHNYNDDVFVRDLQTGAATLVSVNTSGTTGNAGSGGGIITPNGRFVVFFSNATDLVTGDSSTHGNVFERDLATGATTLVSINTNGNGGNGDSIAATVSPDGRYVAFTSYARDLVAGDTSVGAQIYLRDLAAGTTTRVSVGQGSGPFIASNPLVSDNGRYVAFQSRLVYSYSTTDVYVRDVTAGVTSLVSVNTSGTGGGNFDSTNAVMTPDGRYVAFVSLANNLVAGDANNAYDVFVRDLAAKKTTLVSVNSSGAHANSASGVDGWGRTDSPAISSDGRYVAFTSGASNLTGGVSHSLAVFVRDLVGQTTSEVSVGAAGGQPDNFSEHVFMSPDGNFVGFESFAGNLVSTPLGSAAGENIFVRNRSAATTTLVTVNSADSASADGLSFTPSMTSDGSHVAFGSDAQDLVAKEGDRLNDVFVRDLVGQTTTLVSTHDASLPSLTGNGPSDLGVVSSHLNQVSSDGRYVVFTSGADNLVPGDANGQTDVFVADQQTGTLTLASVNTAGTGAGNGGSQRPVISADGRYVVFDSFATDLTSTPDANGGTDVFERDLETGTTTLVSINQNGTAAGAGPSSAAVVSPDGRYIAFESDAPDLTSNADPHHTWNVFLRDMATGVTTLVSVNTSGAAGNGWSGNFHFTPDGRYVVFQSNASDLVPGDANGWSDVFVRDLVNGTTTLVSVNSAGAGPGNGPSDNPDITPDGRYVVFESGASNLAPNDTNGATDVFVRDLVLGTTTLVSVNQAGTASGNGTSQHPSISSDGRYVAFDSSAPDLVSGDSNNATDVFVRDLKAGTTSLVSVNMAGTGSGNGASQYPGLSPDGRYVVFESNASDLAPNDVNGGYVNIFLRDLATGATTLLDPHASKTGYVMDTEYSLSADGQHVAFSAAGDDLTPGDYNYYQDVYVWNSPATHFLVSAPQTTTAGASFTFTVTAQTASGDAATGYTGAVHFTSSDGQAVLPADYTFTAADAGVHTFNVALRTAGPQSLTAADTTTASITGNETGISVNPATASTLTVTGYPSPTTAGASGSFTITALDAYGNVATGYTGTVHFSSSDEQADLPADYTFTADDAGVHTFSATLKTAGTQSVTATDTTTSSIVGSETGISVNPATASTLTVTGYPSPTTAGVSQNFTVAALDAYGNTATGYTGTVHFSSSDEQADLPADYTFTADDAGVHTFSATLKTAGAQSLTAADTTTASITGSETAISVNPATASTLTVTGYPSPTTAGASGSFTITALDAFGNVATGYTGTVHFSSSDEQADLPADYTFTADDAGVHTFSATLKTAGPQSLTATDTTTASIAGSETAISVNPATASTLTVTGYPTPTTAGVSQNFTVTALDAYGNVATGYTGAVHFSSSDEQADLPADYTFTADDAGVHTFSATLKTAGPQSLTATDTTTASIAGSETAISVNPATASTLTVTGYPSPTTAGVSHSITVTALDAYGNTATGYTGTVHFTSSDGQAALPADYTFTAGDAGVHTFSATLKTAGAQSLTAADAKTASIMGSETAISVNPAAASTLTVTGYPSPTTAGVSHSFTVTALDAYGNTATGYKGTVHFTSSDGQVALPANYTFTAGDAGLHTFSATLKTAGTQSIAAKDTASASITGSETAISVSAAAASTLTIASYPSPTTAGVNHSFIVTALDAYGNTATGYTGAVHFTSSDAQAVLPADYTFTAVDAGVHTFSATLKTAGVQWLTAADTKTASITGNETGISVSAAAASTFTVASYPGLTTAGVSHNFTVTALDAYGNTATGYTGAVHFTSSDAQAVLPTDYTFTAGDAGVHTFSANLKSAGAQSITATDLKTASITGKQAGITVAASVATHFKITAPANVTAGVAFSITVTALDAYGNVATGYRGKVHFTSSDHKSKLPSDYTFTSSDNGVHTFTVTMQTLGAQTVTATDAVTNSITGKTSVAVLRH
jgi:Tol biopolymer transport system component